MSNPISSREHDHDPLARDARFDAAMRALHADAVAHVGPHLRARLQPGAARTRAAARPAGRAGWHRGLAFGGALAAVCAVAIGLGLRPSPAPGVASTPAAVASIQDVDASELEQDPDFYAWLASDDATLVAME